MKSNTYLNVLELRDGCNVGELHNVIIDIFVDGYNDEDTNEDKKMEQFYEVVNSSLKKNEFIGASSAFHNVSVECVKRNAEDIACDYLECGLEKYPTSVDLLADYIKYGSVCGRTDKCRKYYNDLNAVPKENWNWRAYRFTIDYLMTEIEKGCDGSEIRQTVIDLANEFRRYIPNDENGYLAQAEIHNKFNEREEEIAILEEAVLKMPKAPKSLLRLADIYYAEGRLEDTLEVLKRCELDSLEIQMGVNQGYLYYLDALCQSNILMRELADNPQIVRDAVYEKTMKIYDDLRIAKKTLDNSFNLQKEWKFVVSILEIKTKIEYPYY